MHSGGFYWLLTATLALALALAFVFQCASAAGAAFRRQSVLHLVRGRYGRRSCARHGACIGAGHACVSAKSAGVRRRRNHVAGQDNGQEPRGQAWRRPATPHCSCSSRPVSDLPRCRGPSSHAPSHLGRGWTRAARPHPTLHSAHSSFVSQLQQPSKPSHVPRHPCCPPYACCRALGACRPLRAL